MRRAAAACLFIVLPAVACRTSSGREARDFERMRRQQRYDLYDTSRFFPSGSVVQNPPAHTVDRERMLAANGPVTSLAAATGAANGSDVADVPIEIDDRARNRGAAQFKISCAPCHGAGGFGGGPIAANLNEKRPPSLRTTAVGAMPAGMLFHIITDGMGRMPAYGWQLPASARWAVIAYVRSLPVLPATNASRNDSLLASDLRQLDSLRAAHADLNTILRTRRREP